MAFALEMQLFAGIFFIYFLSKQECVRVNVVVAPFYRVFHRLRHPLRGVNELRDGRINHWRGR